jgi:uncharacterized Zn-finger protein
MTGSGTIQCGDCGVDTPARSATQRYCPACSTRRDLERKRLWVRDHPPSLFQRVRNSQHASRRKEMVREAGAEASDTAKQGIAWLDPEAPDLIWLARISVPFSYAASKNHIYVKRRMGHVALRREVVAKRQAITLAVQSALAGRQVAHNKVWLDILVQKPDHRGDAVNVVDLVCDAVKDAIGVDDRWFSIRRLDWEVAKTDPRLFIGIGQESDRDCQVCSHCGSIKTLDQFSRRKDSRLGVGRACRDCRHAGRELARRLVEAVG